MVEYDKKDFEHEQRLYAKIAGAQRISALYADLARAAMMLSSDQPKGLVDALYLHGLSNGMVESAKLFDVALSFFYTTSSSPVIAFNGSDGEGMGDQNKPGAAWPGKRWYIEELSRMLEDEECPVPKAHLIPTGPALHTREETDKLVALAKERGWKSVGILSVAYHAVRSMSCLVASMDTAGYWMKAYFITPPTTSWWSQMKGSQGLEETDSFRESEKEAKKVVESYWKNGEGESEYWKKGYGIPPKYLFHYLQYRDQIVAEQKFPLFELK